jgi:alkanesulfonate monooxygenase
LLSYPVTAPSVRLEILLEQLQVIAGLWEDRDFHFSGAHYEYRRARLEPAPRQRPRPPIIVGGRGRRGMLRAAARYADELNLDFVEPPDAAEIFCRLDAEVSAAGRAPGAVRKSVEVHWPEGDHERKAARVRDFVAAGADRIVFFVPQAADQLALVADAAKWLERVE